MKKNSNTFKWLAICVIAVMLFTGCAPTGGYQDAMVYTKPEILSTKSVTDADTLEDAAYAENENFSLFVNEKKATFYVVDKNGNRWDSVPAINPEKYQGKDLVVNNLSSLIQIHYTDVMNSTAQSRSYGDSVQQGNAKVMRIANGVRFEFYFDNCKMTIPLHVTLTKKGVDVSLINAEIQENSDTFTLTSVDVMPYFNAPHMDDDGYIVIPDGSGAVVDWKKAADGGVKYRQSVYGRDNAIIVNDITSSAQSIRLPVFGNQYLPATQEGVESNHQRTGFVAYATVGSSRTYINATLGMKSSPYNSVFAEFIYRESALVKIEKLNKSVRVTEASHTTIPVQNVRYDLLTGAEIDYVDMANAYRGYLLTELGIQPKTSSQSAPLVIELMGGVMKQQFVMGFPVDQVVPLTNFDDAETIVKRLKAAGVGEIIINYTEWQKDATGAAIQTSVKPEGSLGGNKGLKDLLALCKQEGVDIYLNMNTTRMVESAFGYDTSYDSASSVRRDPAMQYYYKVNSGTADVLNPSFCLTPTKMVDLANKLSASAKKYNLAGVSSDFLGENIYSDFDKNATTRDHSEYYWNDTLTTLSGVTGKLLLTGGNAYALQHATLITDAPNKSSNYLLACDTIPFYQIVVHGIVPLTTGAINNASDTRSAFLYAIETGSYLKWDWTARNQDELVETIFNTVISSHYENWIDEAVAQYQEGSALLKKLAQCSITGHEKLSQDLVRVTWSDGTVVYVNYGAQAVTADGVEVAAQNFAVKGGAA